MGADDGSVVLRPLGDADLELLREWLAGRRPGADPIAQSGDERAGGDAALAVLTPDMLPQSVGVVAERAGSPVAMAVAAETVNLFDLRLEGILHTFASPEADESVDAALLRAVEESGRARGWRFLRALRPHATAQARPFSTGWELSGVAVRKALPGDDELPSPPPATVRTAGPDDLPFVTELTAQALRAGLCACERSRLPEADLPAAAERFLEPLSAADSVVLIAEHDGERVGHALARLAATDELTGRVEAEIYDAFVVADHQGAGIARLLTLCVERLAAAEGCQSIRGTVGGGSLEHVERILAGIAGHGWRADHATLVRALE